MPKTFKDHFDASGVLSEVTETAEKQVLIKLVDKLNGPIGDYVNDRVQDALVTAGVRQAPMTDQQKRLDNIRQIWRNNGYSPKEPGKRIEYKALAAKDKERKLKFQSGELKQADVAFQDGAFMWDNPMLIPRVIEDFIREPRGIVPTITPLFQKIRFDGPGQTAVFPAASSYTAGNLDIPEGGTYPEGTVQWAGTVVSTMGKCGIAVRFTEEMLRFSQYDIMGLHLRAAGAALVKWKEGKCARHLNEQGSTFIDNSDPSARQTTGRGIDLQFNGTLTLQDLLAGYTDMLHDGFIPNTLIMHPFAWTIFAQDPTMRAWAYAQGGMIWQRYQGEVQQMRQWMKGMNGTTEMSEGGQAEVNTTYSDVPAIFPYPLRIVVSPFIEYDATDNTTSIILCDSNEIGIIAVNEEATADEFNDPELDIKKVKIRERYSINILNEGRALRVFKNVILERGWDVDDRFHVEASTPLPTGKSYSL